MGTSEAKALCMISVLLQCFGITHLFRALTEKAKLGNFTFMISRMGPAYGSPLLRA